MSIPEVKRNVSPAGDNDMVEVVGSVTPKLPSDPALSDEDRGALVSCIATLVELLVLYGFDDHYYVQSDAVKHWAAHALQCGWVKWAKYKLAAFFSFHTGQDLPQSPSLGKDNPGDLLTGKAQRFIRRYLRMNPAGSRGRMEFLTSILQLKKGLPRPGLRARDKAKTETFKVLTTFVEPVRYAQVHGQEKKVSFDDLLEESRRTVREVFRGRRLDDAQLLRAFMPSLSANYNNTRSDHGTLGHLIDLGLLNQDDVLPIFRPVVSTTPDGQYALLKQQEWLLPSDDYVVHEEGRHAPTVPPKAFVVTNYDQLSARFTATYLSVLQMAANEEPDTALVALPEALKVRVISKGPPLTYFCLKPVQKFMWQILADHPVFQLVGKPVTSDILEDVIGPLAEGEAYLSGDYKAATDNLRGELSEAIWLEICNVCEFPAGIAALGLRALTGHNMLNPDDKTKSELRPQRAGQLMGSIISFPILCLANATVCRMAMELGQGKTLRLGRRHQKRLIAGLPLLINGDDCLFRIGENGRLWWKALSTMAGLEESIGKCYYSKEFANVNSTNFLWETRKCADVCGDFQSFVQTGYVNFGLLRGLKRSGGKTGALELDSDLSSRCSELLRLAPTSMNKEMLMRKFLSANAKSLELFTQNRIPWFVPREYGGVGLPPVGKFGPSRTDLRVVAAMLYRTHPRAPHPVVFRDAVALRLHELTKFVCEHQGVTFPVRYCESRESGADFRPLYLWTLYMTPSIVKATLSNFEEGAALMEQLRQNRRCWSFYERSQGALPPPIENIRPRFLVADGTICYPGRGM